MVFEFILGGKQRDGLGKRFLSLNADFTTHQQYLGSYISSLSLSVPIYKKGKIILLRVLVRMWNKLMYVKCLAECLEHRRDVNMSFVFQVWS